MSKVIEITVGGTGPYDPEAGTNVCIIPALKNKVIWIDKAGVGPFKASLYTRPALGGFQLASGTFQAGDFYRVYSESVILGAAPSNYTNGFNSARVLSALVGRIGWRSSTAPGQPVLNGTNGTSASGRWYNEAHALCTIPNIKSVLDNASISDNDFNDELLAIQVGGIMRMLNAVFCKKEYIEQCMVYERYGYAKDQVIENNNSFAGYEINLATAFDKATQIEAAVLLFDQDVSFDLYLFKDGKKNPIWTQNVSALAFEQTIVNFDELILSYINNETKGTRFYLGYFQTDLGGARAINEQSYQWAKTFMFSARPFYSAKKAGVNEFETTQRYYPQNAMGLNLQISSFSDWTAKIERYANLFDELNMLVTAAAVVEKVIYTTAQNGTQRILLNGIAAPAAIQDLSGVAPVSDGPPPVTGLKTRIDREIKRVSCEFFPKPTAKLVEIC